VLTQQRQRRCRAEHQSGAAQEVAPLHWGVHGATLELVGGASGAPAASNCRRYFAASASGLPLSTICTASSLAGVALATLPPCTVSRFTWMLSPAFTDL